MTQCSRPIACAERAIHGCRPSDSPTRPGRARVPDHFAGDDRIFPTADEDDRPVAPRPRHFRRCSRRAPCEPRVPTWVEVVRVVELPETFRVERIPERRPSPAPTGAASMPGRDRRLEVRHAERAMDAVEEARDDVTRGRRGRARPPGWGSSSVSTNITSASGPPARRYVSSTRRPVSFASPNTKLQCLRPLGPPDAGAAIRRVEPIPPRVYLPNTCQIRVFPGIRECRTRPGACATFFTRRAQAATEMRVRRGRAAPNSGPWVNIRHVDSEEPRRDADA